MAATPAQKAALAKANAAKAAKKTEEPAVSTVDTEPTIIADMTPAQIEEHKALVPDRDPLDDVADSVVAGVSPGRAREEAAAALVRSRASGVGAQAELERRVHQRLSTVADAHDKELERQAELRQRQSLAFAPQGPDGHPAEPMPESIRRGAIVHVHQDPRQPDTFALVLRLHPKVRVGDSEHRWRADLALFPLHGTPSVGDGIPYGHGVGQFSEPPADESDTGARVPGLPDGEYEKQWESRI